MQGRKNCFMTLNEQGNEKFTLLKFDTLKGYFERNDKFPVNIHSFLSVFFFPFNIRFL